MVYLMYGAEDFLLRRQKETFRQQAGEFGYGEFTDVYEAVTHLSTTNFFTDKLYAYLVVEKFKEILDKGALNAFADIAKENDKNLLICYYGSPTAAELKKLAKYSDLMSILEYKKLKGAELKRAVDMLCKMQEANFTDQAKETLLSRLDYANNDSVTLVTVDNFIGQLKYLSPLVEKVDVENNVPDLTEGQRFKLSRMIVSGNSAAVIREADKLMAERDFSAIALLSLIFRDFRIAHLQNTGFSLSEQGVRFANLGKLPDKVCVKCMNTITGHIRDIKSDVYDEHTVFKLCLTELLYEIQKI